MKPQTRNFSLIYPILSFRPRIRHIRDRQPQIFVGIYRGVINADFVVEVRTGAAATLADKSDGVAAMHVLACHDGKVGQSGHSGW